MGSVEKPLDGFQRGVQPFNHFRTANGSMFLPIICVPPSLDVASVFKISSQIVQQTFLCKQNILFFLNKKLFSYFPLVSRRSRSSFGSSGLSWPLCKASSSAGPSRWSVTEMSGCSCKPKPRLCCTRRWSRKWPLKGGSRSVRLRVC